MRIWILENKDWIAGLIGGIIMFFTGRKTAKNQEVSGELQNLKSIREVEKDLIDDIKGSVKEYQLLLDEKDKIIKAQAAKIERQKALIDKQISEIKTLKSIG